MTPNGGPRYKHSEAASISVLTRHQEESGQLGSALSRDGEEEGLRAWLKDRFGVSWQIVPEAVPRLLVCDHSATAARAMRSMMKIAEIDIAKLQAASNGA